jgi:Leucine-rich repeat (LRR) protein
MAPLLRSWFVPLLALPLLAPAARAGDDEAAAKKLMKPGFRVVMEGQTLVEFHATGATDADLEGLGQFKSLRVLGLGNSQVTDAGLKHLAGIDSLEVLQLYNSRKITGKGLKEIAGNKKLRELWVDDWQVNDEALVALGGAGKLHTLRQAPAGKSWAASDADITDFNLSSQGVSDASLKALAGLKSLKVLRLYGPNISDKGMKDIAALTTLRNLTLRGTKLTDAGLKEIAGLKSLEVLFIDGAPITDAGMEVIAGFKFLHTLYMNSPAVTPDGLRHLAGLPLHTFGPPRLTDAHLRTLAAINKLHALSEARTEKGERPNAPEQVFSLNLYGQPVTGAGLKELKGLKSLQLLHLEGTGVTADDLLELAAVPSLAVVKVDNALVTDKTLALLRKHGLLHLLASETRRPGQPAKTVTILVLEKKPITDAGLKELAGIQSLETLYLGNTAVTDEGLKVLATLPALRTLRLNGTQVSDAGLAEVAKVPKLVMLNLDNTKVTPSGLKALLDHPALEQISLAPSQINDEVLQVLRASKKLHLLAAAHTKSGKRPRSDDEITTVVLRQSKVTDAGLKELTGLKAMVLLNVGQTQITNQAVDELKKELPKLKNVLRN